MILRPSMVHNLLQAVQPRSSPNRFEARPDLPIVPPQTHSSPGMTRAALRPNTREGSGVGCTSWRMYAAAATTLPTTTTMMIVTR
jgi:hypothetical protein